MASKIIFGIDDVCPQRKADAGMDFGGDLEQGILGMLLDFAKEFPKIKYTLFITPNYVFKAQLRYFSLFQKAAGKVFGKSKAAKLSKHWRCEPFRLDKHPEFCSFLKRYSQKGLFSLELHGYNHFYAFQYYPREFYGLTVQECSEKLSKAVELFGKAGFEKPKVFAPPGWLVSGALLEALKIQGFKLIAGSIDNSAIIERNSFSKGSGLQGVSAFLPQEINGLINIPRNWDLRFGTVEKARQLIQLDGLLAVQAHAAEEGIQNAITQENLNNLRKILSSLEKEFGNLKFSHFRELRQVEKQ